MGRALLVVLTTLLATGCATTISLDEALARENTADRQLHEHQRLAHVGVRFGADLPPEFVICLQQPIRELRQQPDACFTLGELRLQRFGRPRLAGSIFIASPTPLRDPISFSQTESRER